MNPVIGDKALKGQPEPMTEVDKIRCHLSYALSELKEKTTKEQTHRAKLLAKLETYIENGMFPCNENEGFPGERFPCFLDSFGTPCAVAHLMQQSGATRLASAIGTSHKYGSIAEITADEELLPHIESWAATVDLKVKELALIQPTYEFVAREARALFGQIEAKLLQVSSASSCMSDSEKHQLANLIVRFGDTMVTEYGYTKGDIPDYLKRIEKLQRIISNDQTEILKLLDVLLKEAKGASRERGTLVDYEGLLSPEDLDFMTKSDISNRRVPRKD